MYIDCEDTDISAHCRVTERGREKGGGALWLRYVLSMRKREGAKECERRTRCEWPPGTQCWTAPVWWRCRKRKRSRTCQSRLCTRLSSPPGACKCLSHSSHSSRPCCSWCSADPACRTCRCRMGSEVAGQIRNTIQAVHCQNYLAAWISNTVTPASNVECCNIIPTFFINLFLWRKPGRTKLGI